MTHSDKSQQRALLTKGSNFYLVACLKQVCVVFSNNWFAKEL